MRILVVEDEADLNLLLCKVLTKAATPWTVPGRRGRPGSPAGRGIRWDSAGCDAAQKGRIHPGAGTAGPRGTTPRYSFSPPGTVWPTGSRGWTWAGTTIWSNPLTLPSCWPVSGP